jgi:hypothetical protein
VDADTQARRVAGALQRAGVALYAVSRKPDADDLLCDLLHWMEGQGRDPEQAVRDALSNWRAERLAQLDATPEQSQ